MKVILSCEFAGYPLKELVLEHLIASGHEVIDVGQKSASEKVLYPDAAAAAARALQNGEADKAVVICGSGAGVSIVCNKFKGVYCVACESPFTADGIPFINNANALAMGYNVVGKGQAFAMVDAFLANGFVKGAAPERAAFLRSLFNMVQDIEDENFK
ncbi:MAG: RpiB/LacA/LacB family sugar-phosphate isomerase [Clostridia bacterium]|nr:RpiB/LacA/LacB family sugar-phosphate isomerase [Clostridia bacterium]